jgi:hypothetical protein
MKRRFNLTAIHQAPLQALRFFVPISASALVLKTPFSTSFAVATVGLLVSAVHFLVVESNTTYYSIPYLTVACAKAGAIAATATALAIKKRFMASSRSFYCLNACNAS